MGISVNKVAVGYNYTKCTASDVYRRFASCCPAGTGLFDGSSIICKAGGTAWFVAPRSTEIYCPNNPNPEADSLACVTLVTGISDWFLPDSTLLNNPGYVCRNNWVTCTPGVGISTNYTTCITGQVCSYYSTTGAYIFKGPNNRLMQNFGDGGVSCYDLNDATNKMALRRFRCVTY